MSDYITSVTHTHTDCDLDDDDEFGGLMVDIDVLKTKSGVIDDDDEFGGLTVDIEALKAKSESAPKPEIKPAINKDKSLSETVAEILELPKGWDEVGFDTEYIPQTDAPTQPFCISLHSAENCAEYLHPESHPAKFAPVMVDVKRKMRKIAELHSLRVFKTPFVILDFLADTYKIQWRPIKDLQRRRVKTIKLYFFFSFKDLEFLFAKSPDYLYYCLSMLERIRRITTKFNKPIALPYEIYLPTNRGMKWQALSIELVDICAMQGAKGLKTYLQNVGLSTDEKTVWDFSKKDNNALNFLIQKPREFINYIRGDVKYLKTVHDKTIEFYNDIAATVGVKASEDWGLSTGKITASIASQWLASRPNVMLPTTENNEFKEKPFYWYNRLASPEAMKQLSHLVGNQALLYLGMTDGGRCVKERSTIDVLDGVLVDIDINGCYGNGLKNQIFPVGNPSIISLPMNFGDWEIQYSKYLIPGLWVARISWKNSPFKQDLLLSKEEKSFTSWEWYQSHYSENNSDTDKQYDASMYLATNQVHMAAFNHDLYQVIQKYTSNEEKAWIRENAIVECFAYYDKRDEIDKVIPEMCEIKSVKEVNWCSPNQYCTKWVRVELKDLANTLIDRRASHKNKVKLYNKHFGKDNKDAIIENVESTVIDSVEFTKEDWLYQNSVQEFIKLIVNTIYGCIASSYFAGDGTGISNFVVGNNITARARTLAWCMGKGLFSLMSITDGGVFNVNKVAFYKRKSLDIFTNLGFENFQNSSRNTVVEIKSLYGSEISQDESMFDVLDKNNHVQDLAWQHLNSQFGELDIFKLNQFSFEVKKIYTECQIRNKSDYRLYNAVNGEKTIKIRGLSKKNGKDGDDVAASIFQNIANNENEIHELTTTRLLGLSEWRNYNSEKRKTLLPHDEISDTKKFYSFTPLGCKFINSKHRKDVLRLYEQLKQWERPELMEQVRLLENVTDEAEYKRIKKQIKSKD